MPEVLTHRQKRRRAVQRHQRVTALREVVSDTAWWVCAPAWIKVWAFKQARRGVSLHHLESELEQGVAAVREGLPEEWVRSWLEGR